MEVLKSLEKRMEGVRRSTRPLARGPVVMLRAREKRVCGTRLSIWRSPAKRGRRPRARAESGVAVRDGDSAKLHGVERKAGSRARLPVASSASCCKVPRSLLTSSISLIASSTLPGLMLLLPFSRSTFRRLLIALFVAVWESSRI